MQKPLFKKILLSIVLLITCEIQAELVVGKPAPATGMAVAMDGHLTATSGVVDLTFALPQEWPPDGDQTLFHVGEKSHTHVTLFCRKGVLIAVYKADEEHHAAINHVAARLWKPGETHRLQFQWKSEGKDVPFYLRVDGKLVGSRQGRLIEEWPERFYLGIRGKHSPWQGTINTATLASMPPPLPEHTPGSRAITVDTGKVEGEIYNFWSIANYTRQDQFTENVFRVEQKRAHPWMRYVNCVRLLGGRLDGRQEWFKGVDDKGRPIFAFEGLVAILQGIMDAGYTPRIVLDNVPLAMSGDVKMEKYGNTYPPKDYAVWEAYIEGAVRAMVNAFGEKRVGSWRFRVGTEPDLYPGHWIGTPEQYKHHYTRTVTAVQRVIPEPDIGPGNIIDTKHGEWGLDLIDFVAEKGLPMTFFSSSWYGRVGEEQQGFEENVAAMRSRLSRYERFRDIPLEIAEFAILQDEYNQRLWCGDATEWGASWYAGIAEKVYRLNVAQIHQWATVTSGLHHPRSHLHTMLGKMAGGERLAVSVTDASSNALAGAIASRKDDAIYVLLYNHRAQRAPSVPETITLKVSDVRMKAGEGWLVDEWLVDRDHGVFIHAFNEDCREAGLQPLPESGCFEGNIRLRWGDEGSRLLRENYPKYAGLSNLPQTKRGEKLVVQDGAVTMTIGMAGHSVRLVKLVQ